MLEILEVLRKYYPSTVVLGGDILDIDNPSQIRYAYANWHYDQKDASESIKVTKQYLGKFDHHAGRDTIYVDLVVDNISRVREQHNQMISVDNVVHEILRQNPKNLAKERNIA